MKPFALVLAFIALLSIIAAPFVGAAIKPNPTPAPAHAVTHAQFAADARALAKMLNMVADQAEAGGNAQLPLVYVRDAYPPMVRQMGVVLSELGQAQLVKWHGPERFALLKVQAIAAVDRSEIELSIGGRGIGMVHPGRLRTWEPVIEQQCVTVQAVDAVMADAAFVRRGLGVR